MIISLLICAITDCHGKSPMRSRTFGPVGKKRDLYPDKKGKWHNVLTDRVAQALIKTALSDLNDQDRVILIPSSQQ